jgi:hypothetical protein
LPNPSITDWLTSGATIATAIGAGLAAWVTFLGYRLAIRRASPVIEPDIYWISSADTGRCLQIHLTVKNRLDETLRLGRLSIKTPKGCLISLGRWEPQGDNLFPARGDAAFLDLANAPRPGDLAEHRGLPGRADRKQIVVREVLGMGRPRGEQQGRV